MRVTYDPAKRAKTLADRGLDFEDAVLIFQGTTVEVEDKRKNYGEPRIIWMASWGAGLSLLGTHFVVRCATYSA